MWRARPPSIATSGHRGREMLLAKASNARYECFTTHLNAVLSARLELLEYVKVKRLASQGQAPVPPARRGLAKGAGLLTSTCKTERARLREGRRGAQGTQLVRPAELRAPDPGGSRVQSALGALCCRSASSRSLTLGLPSDKQRRLGRCAVERRSARGIFTSNQ